MTLWRAAVVAVLLACAGPSPARDVTVLVPPVEDDATRAFLDALMASAAVKEVGLVFKPVAAGDFGRPPSQAANLVLEGAVSFALLRSSQVPGFQTDTSALKFTSLMSHPLIVRDSRQQFFVEDSVVGDAIKQELGRKGFVVLDFWNAPPSSLLLRRTVKTFADLKGLKVRAPSPQSGDVLKAFGASPTPLPFAEVYQALERGSVDGFEVRLERDSPLLGAIKGGSLVASFQQGQGFLVANEAAWIALRQRERAAIQSAATDARNRARAAVLRTEASLPDIARNRGVVHTSFSALGNDQATVRSTWLKRAGGDGASALSLFDKVLRDQPPTPTPPASSPRGAVAPRVFFATNRNDEGGDDLSYRFGVARSKALMCGEVQYTPDPARAFGTAHARAISVVASHTVAGPALCAQLLRPAARTASGGIVVFIHGYRNSFNFAVRRAIAFAQDFGISVPVLVFSWPSLDQVSGYVYDVGSVTFSRPFAKDLIEALQREPEVGGISLLAHSMGSQIALQVLEFASQSPKSLDAVVFVAPDVPRDNFIQGIQLYGENTRLATLYANAHDRALLVSQTVNRQAPAGMGGALRLTTKGVETVDVSEVDWQWNEQNHSHGFDVRKVANDVSLVLRQKAKASMRNLPSAVHDGITYWVIKP